MTDYPEDAEYPNEQEGARSAPQDLLQQFRETKDELSAVHDQLSAFAEAAKLAREQAGDDEETYQDLIQRAASHRAQVEKELKRINARVEKALQNLKQRMVCVLSQFLDIDATALTEIESGDLSLEDAAKDRRIGFKMDTQQQASFEASELFGSLTDELEKKDAVEVLQQIATNKIASVLGGAQNPPKGAEEPMKKKKTTTKRSKK